MATTYAHDGDTIIVGRHTFTVNDNGDGDVELLPVVNNDNNDKGNAREGSVGTVYVNIRVPVYISDNDLAGVQRSEFEDAAGAACFVARNKVGGVIHRAFGDAFDVDIDSVVMRDVCEGCGRVLSDPEYKSGDGTPVCASCVQRALTYIAVRDVLSNIGDYDVPLARVVGVLENDDVRMRASGQSYVDSLSSAYDDLRGDSPTSTGERVRELTTTVVRALTSEH